jgi:hypothetical protein
MQRQHWLAGAIKKKITLRNALVIFVEYHQPAATTVYSKDQAARRGIPATAQTNTTTGFKRKVLFYFIF